MFMIASGMVCQAVSHTGYGWGASLLTLLAIGIQGQEVNEPPTPYVGTPGDVVEVRKGGSMANPGSTVRELLQGTREDKQAPTTTSRKDSRFENTEHHTERAERNCLFMEKAEQSLLFLTAAGTVCQIGGDCEWYGLCVLTLAMLASGDLWVRAEEEEGPPCLREKRATSQEKYHLEAYDCNEPEEIRVYPTPPQCPEIKGLVSPSTLSKTK